MLDPGERDAIQLAKEEHADLLLMDERLGVRMALRRGLMVTGTLGVLVQAARRCKPGMFQQARQRGKEKGGKS